MRDMPTTVGELLNIVKQYGFEYFNLYYGIYRGFIVSNEDPLKMGRVQIRVPQITGDSKLEYWAWPKGQPAGDDFGDFFVPPKGSSVWVEFENGDPQHPVWSGGHWGKNSQVVPSTGAGNPKNRIRSSEKWIFEMDDENDVLRIESKAGGHKIEITGDGNITINGDGNFNQECGGNFTEETTGNKLESITGNKNLTCALLGFTIAGLGGTIAGYPFDFDSAGGMTFTIGDSVIGITETSITFSVGASSISIDASGVTIMGKDFLTHLHSGVDAGPSNTGGVV